MKGKLKEEKKYLEGYLLKLFEEKKVFAGFIVEKDRKDLLL
jgi:hypothetical protein